MINNSSKIDGKVMKAIIDAPSYQHCPLCHKKQSEFNKDNVEFKVLEDFEKYGLNTLHCGINAVKAILKIASQLDIKKHRVYGSQNKLKKEVRAKRNAEKLWEELGIRVENWFTVNGILKFA